MNQKTTTAHTPAHDPSTAAKIADPALTDGQSIAAKNDLGAQAIDSGGKDGDPAVVA